MDNKPIAAAFAPNCVSIDLEVGLKSKKINSFAAVRGDNKDTFNFHGGNLAEALTELDSFCAEASFLLGHNLIDFDLPYLKSVRSDLNLLKKPAVDTLRLNPLAFPRNPYHHLVKHYQDGQIKRGQRNDPLLDARLTLDVFQDQLNALQTTNSVNPDLILAWHWLTTLDEQSSAVNSFFTTLRRKTRPESSQALSVIRKLLEKSGCPTHAQEITRNAAGQGWPLAYTLAWLSVSGGNSVLPPWVMMQFPRAYQLIRLLRDSSCKQAQCAWCSEQHSASKQLKRWFGFDGFRPQPAGEDGRSLQEIIVESAMAGDHVLGILPTGTGKSICYQIPALSRYYKTGALTVVVSPLVALMADQVRGLEKQGITSCIAINGMLSLPERSDALDRVRLGDIGILLISPEQLRNKSVRKVLAQREIGSWVLDEAHCVSKWGHDFRPDYRYVSRFIKEKADLQPVPSLLCLTATAKPDVLADIVDHFQTRVGIELKVYNGGAARDNLEFSVIATTEAEKFSHVYQMIYDNLPSPDLGGAIVYCATRKQTEEMTQYLLEKEIAAAYFHSQLSPDRKRDVQERFINGELQVIAATNAFGMGIDKPDVRLVIHADIPGSLENYLQEAGRAGRDRRSASCVLFFTKDDVERQFKMSARSRLTQQEIQAILRSLKRLDRKQRFKGEVVATAGEILSDEQSGHFVRDSATDDTRVRTAVAWLEEASLLSREQNEVQIFPSSLLVNSVDEARQKLAKGNYFNDYHKQLITLVDALLTASPDEGISTDELMGVSGLSSEKLRVALHDLESLGIANNDTALTAFVHAGVQDSSAKRLSQSRELERALIARLREEHPDLTKGEWSTFHVRLASQALKDEGYANVLPERLIRILKGIAADGRDEDGVGSIKVETRGIEELTITLQREWQALDKTAERRAVAASRLLDHLLSCLPPASRGKDLLAQTTLGKLRAVIVEDLELKAEVLKPDKLLDRALMWLHEMEIIRLNKGLAVFRPAMTIKLGNEKRKFLKADYAPLSLHYKEQVVQIHIMTEYVQRGLEAMAQALQLTMDYFALTQETFLDKWMPGRENELALQTTPESWRSIVENLNNSHQQRVVSDDREQTNTLLLAGPGSGKTRVLVHRIAYLVRVKRENPRGIIALAYNRHAAAEIRKRLHALIADDARGITIMTCHALAMRLVGVSFSKQAIDENSFKRVLQEAVALLKGEGLEPEEADEQRGRILAGFRWMLVDEYQDVGPEQYELICALAGRSLEDKDSKLTLFAVGDDDQNIYSFQGASVEFIRRFEADYSAEPVYLLENYRSSGHIISAANQLIAPASQRMKVDKPIIVNRQRQAEHAGGGWKLRDPLAQGKVQLLTVNDCGQEQAVAVMTELGRLASLDDEWRWDQCAVISRNWEYLHAVRAWCELNNIPAQMANEDASQFWKLRETQALLGWIRSREGKLINPGDIKSWLESQAPGPWWSVLHEALDTLLLETAAIELAQDYFLEWLVEWGREFRRQQSGLLLTTAHRAKGLEFDHVAVLDGGWNNTSSNEDADASRRLYYVAMTRARQTLLLARNPGQANLFTDGLMDGSSTLVRQSNVSSESAVELSREYKTLSLKQVNLGYAGLFADNHDIHRRIAALEVGAVLQLRHDKRHWEMFDEYGGIVGRVAAAYSPPAGKRLIAAKVFAIVISSRQDSAPEYQDRCRCEKWEVVIPELVFE